MKQSESIANLAAALAKFHEHITPIVKDRTNTYYSNKYATLDTILETIRPVLYGHGLTLLQGGVPCERGEIAVETMLVHTSGEWMSSVYTVPLTAIGTKKGETPGDPTAQAAGSAITYARRYGVSSMLSLSTDDDDDGHAASAPPVRASTPTSTAHKGTATKLFPFGKLKGTPLGELSTAQLTDSIAWCSSDAEKSEKFKDLIAALRDVATTRAA